MSEVFVWNFKFWSSESEEWEEVSYFSSEDNQQLLTEHLIREEEGKAEDISLVKQVITWDEFSSYGYGKEMLVQS